MIWPFFNNCSFINFSFNFFILKFNSLNSWFIQFRCSECSFNNCFQGFSIWNITLCTKQHLQLWHLTIESLISKCSTQIQFSKSFNWFMSNFWEWNSSDISSRWEFNISYCLLFGTWETEVNKVPFSFQLIIIINILRKTWIVISQIVSSESILSSS